MKKTLLTVLCLALGVSFANAQTNSEARTVNKSQKMAMATTADRNVRPTSYKASIFQTKDAIWSTSFSTADAADGKYSTGTITTATTYGSVEVPAHTTATLGSTWTRIADTTRATAQSTAVQQNFPRLMAWLGGRFLDFCFPFPNHADGFMLLSMLESEAAPADNGAYDAYIAFQNFSTTGVPVVDMVFTQGFRKFNRDRSYIDYSTDGTTWNTMEIMVNGIDCRSNDWVLGQQVYTLPLAVANQANVYVRLRWACTERTSGVFGYFWAVDDVQFVAGNASRMRMAQFRNVEGFYQTMPAGLAPSLTAFYRMYNTGSTAQTNVKANIYAMNDGGVEDHYSTPTSIATSQVLANLPFNPLDDTVLIIDPKGQMTSAGTVYGTEGSLPTNIPAGSHGFYYTAIESDGVASLATTDTFSYTVNSNSVAGMDQASVWGYDNGVLRKYARFAYGFTTNGYISSSPSSTGWTQPDYEVLLGYATGSTLPENWVIRGLQLVGSTPYLAEGLDINEARGAGTSITPMLRFDTTVNGSPSVYTIDHGGNVHEISASELPVMDGLTYAMPGNYNVINIPFLKQPKLRPNKNYWIGYKQTTGGNFAVATSAHLYFDENHYTGSTHDTVSVPFSEVDGMHAYAKPIQYTNCLIHDPQNPDQRYYYETMSGAIGTSIPMIRMIVGPKVQLTQYTLGVTCGSSDVEIYASNGTNICGETDSMVQGATYAYYVQPVSSNFQIEQILIDGQPIANGAVIGDISRNDRVDDQEGITYAVISIVNAQANHTISATVRAVGINDPAAKNVNMTLQPNPATSNVNLTISGVTGMVNYSLIDMSGRTISSNRINAETVTPINVSNLAKGAYFVRITNDNFSKVEKLIVR